MLWLPDGLKSFKIGLVVYDTILASDGRTDRQTSFDSKDRASIASRG